MNRFTEVCTFFLPCAREKTPHRLNSAFSSPQTLQRSIFLLFRQCPVNTTFLPAPVRAASISFKFSGLFWKHVEKQVEKWHKVSRSNSNRDSGWGQEGGGEDTSGEEAGLRCHVSRWSTKNFGHTETLLVPQEEPVWQKIGSQKVTWTFSIPCYALAFLTLTVFFASVQVGRHEQNFSCGFMWHLKSFNQMRLIRGPKENEKFCKIKFIVNIGNDIGCLDPGRKQIIMGSSRLKMARYPPLKWWRGEVWGYRMNVVNRKVEFSKRNVGMYWYFFQAELSVRLLSVCVRFAKKPPCNGCSSEVLVCLHVNSV